MPAHRMFRRGLMIACGLSLACSALTFAAPASLAPPTDAEIQAKLDALAKWQKDTPPAERTYEKYQAEIRSLLKDVNVDELSLANIEKLWDMLSNDPDVTAAMSKRLSTLADDKGVDGANAAVLVVGMSMNDQKAMTAALERALEHPAILDAVKTDTGAQIFAYLGYADKDAIGGMVKQIVALQSALGEDMSPSAMAGAMQYFSVLNSLGDKVDPATKEAVRKKVSDAFLAAATKAKAEQPENKKAIERLENNYKYLNGAFAKGELIDHHAPAMNFLWSSGETPIKSLDQFKGKVVIVDFWATWCGPCVASFPHVKKLQERYKDYPVVIIGVTSPQGAHYNKDHSKIDTTDNPKKEFELMPGFMKDMDMTWQVAFTQENVFNPDFGVRGIPHVAIIDPEGIVRYNGLHPMMPMKEKAEKIDSLLTKAGLATPGPVAEDEKAPESAKKPG